MGLNIPKIAASFFCVSCFYSSSAQVPAGRIVFASRANDSSNTELYSVSSNGTDEHKITTANGKDKDLPSAFHNRIVYRQVENNKSQRASFFITGVNGGPAKPVIQNKVVCYPRWSHDGRLIAYENYQVNKPEEIWVIDSNGKNDRKLISNARHPYWSRDDKIMLFTRSYEVWMRDMAKGTERRLTDKKDTTALFPALSPDGKLFAYNGQFKANGGIFISEMNTGKVLKYAPYCGDPFFWTDDPDYIVCAYLRPGEPPAPSRIILLNVRTGDTIPIPNGGRSNYFPCWVNQR